MTMGKEEIFWGWFKTNSATYYHLNKLSDIKEKEDLLEKFLKELHKYCDKLFFEIGGIPNEVQELIISAAGNKDYFDKVERLVAKAPKIHGWQIVAFKPAMGIDFVTKYEDVKLDPQQIWFLPLENENDPEELGLKVCLPNYNPKKEKVFIAGCYQLFDTILGEKSAALDIKHVEVDILPNKPEEKGLIELTELQKYVFWRKTKAKQKK
jgi:hypothetical protein